MAKAKKVITPLKKAFNNYNSAKSRHCRNARLTQGYLACSSVQAQNNYLRQVVLPKLANAINAITSLGGTPPDWPVLTVPVDKGKGKGKEKSSDDKGKGKGKEKSSDDKSKGKGKEKSSEDKGKGKGKERESGDNKNKDKGNKRPKSGDDKGGSKKKKRVKEPSPG
jgi:hypothetical protein